MAPGLSSTEDVVKMSQDKGWRNVRDLATRPPRLPRLERVVGLITAALLLLAAVLEVYGRWPR